jgi:putative tricarboxylic transport membrane protein
MPSPAEPVTEAKQRTDHAAARVALVATPGAVAMGVGLLAWLLSFDLNPRDAGYPRALATLLLVVGLWNLIGDLRERGRHNPADAEYGRLVIWRIAAFIGLVALCIWLVKPIGFYPAGGLLILGGLAIMGIRKPLILIGYPLALVGIGYVLFSIVLGVPLPLARGF